jgi:hypothetical protein
MLLVAAMLLYASAVCICHLDISCFYSGVLDRGNAPCQNH